MYQVLRRAEAGDLTLRGVARTYAPEPPVGAVTRHEFVESFVQAKRQGLIK